jgi:hypothetical protein
MKLGEITKGTGKIVEHKDIPINKLDAMLCYQRDIDMSFVEEKSRDDVFDEKEVNEVKVSVRSDGSYKVCDGQHTIAILNKRGWTTAPCELRYGLSIEEENDWFTTTNTKSRTQSRKRTLTSQINGTYKKNKTEQDFNNCIKSLGFKLNIYNEDSGSAFKIGCPIKLLEVYKTYCENNNLDGFIECLDIIRTCFNGDPSSLQWNCLRGMFDFYEAYGDQFDKKRLVTVLKKIPPADLKIRTDKDTYTKKSSLRYARLFANEYNFGLSKDRKLKMSKLED